MLKLLKALAKSFSNLIQFYISYAKKIENSMLSAEFESALMIILTISNPNVADYFAI